MPSFTMQAMEKIPSVVSIGGIFLNGNVLAYKT